MCRDALHREESCGGHFRVEHQTGDGEARRNDEDFSYVAAWEWTGDLSRPGPAQGMARIRRGQSFDAELQVTYRTYCRMNLHLKVWRQKNQHAPGGLAEYEAHDIPAEASFLEMLDIVNERLIDAGEEPIAFDHDCREGICGMCSLTINGRPHGGKGGVSTCQLHMREFEDDQTIVIEPFRAQAFPVIRDLSVNRSAFDAVIQAGGFVSVRTGAAPEANSMPVEKDAADRSFDAAACIGCGACVAACKNASAMLFVAAKVAHLNALPQGQPEHTAASSEWFAPWTPPASATAPTNTSAPPSAPPTFPPMSSRA